MDSKAKSEAKIMQNIRDTSDTGAALDMLNNQLSILPQAFVNIRSLTAHEQSNIIAVMLQFLRRVTQLSYPERDVLITCLKANTSLLFVVVIMPNIRDTGAASDLDTCGMVFNLPKWAEYIEAYPGRIREYNDSLTIESDWRKKFEESWFEQGYRIPVLDRIPKEDAIRFNPSIPFLDSSFLPSLNSFMRLLSSSSSFGLSQTLFDDVVAYEQVVLAFETELLKYRRYRNYVAESKSLTDSFKLALWDRMMFRLLLSRGANIEHRDERGILPIDLVPRQWRDEVRSMFEAVVANAGRLPEDYPVSSILFEEL